MTDTDLAKLALHFAGMPKINDIDDATDEAEVSKLFIPVVRQTFIRQSKLSITRKEEALSSATGETSNVYDYVYEMPSDYLHPIKIQNFSSGTDPVRYELGAHSAKTSVVLKTDHNDTTNGTVLIYCTDIENLNVYRQDSIVAMAYLLASYLVATIKRDEVKAEKLEGKYLIALSIVKANDKNSQSIDVVDTEQFDELLNSRN